MILGKIHPGTALETLRVAGPANRGPYPNYDVSADGQRFVAIAPADQETDQPQAIRIVQNWFAEFRDRDQD